jgi:hypothetical protein
LSDRTRNVADDGAIGAVPDRETTMRLVVFSSLLIAGPAVLSAGAVSNGAAEERSHALPEIVIGGGSSAVSAGGGPNAPPANGGANAARATERCVEVEIGSSKSMDCLNQKLKREVDRVSPTINQPPIDARSPDTKVGVINIPGVQQQYGKNFGVSVVPFRPAPPTFPPFGGRH